MQEEPIPAVSDQSDDPRDPAAKVRTFPTTPGVYLMKDAGGNVSEAARLLGLHRNSLKAKLARWKIRPRDLRSDAQ